MNAQHQALRRDLLDELEWEPKLGDAQLNVTIADDGVVTLTGVVKSYAQKIVAERAVQRVRGVHAVVNDVDVKERSAHDTADSELAASVVDALGQSARVPRGKIRASVSDGWVRLEGEVDRKDARTAAEKALYRLRGVRGITNRIRIHGVESRRPRG